MVVPDLQAALQLLQGHRLIPEGSHALTGKSLVSGLLHFAFVAPTSELARQGLIAFAYLAKDIFADDSQTAVSEVVLEHAEDHMRLRLDYHTSHVEDCIKDFAVVVEEMREEVERCTGELRDACERVRGAEDALLEARTGWQEAATQAPSAAPLRVRRAATLADLLQRQVMVRGAALQAEDGVAITDKALCERTREVLVELERSGLTPPRDGTLENARILPHGDVIFTFSSIDLTKWIHKPAVAKLFSRKMGMTARLVERMYRLVAERVPVTFDPKDEAALRAIEEAHQLAPNTITHANWIKPLHR
ncbi:hypothetical protein C2E23DRAFT_881303 [Lenzites betulinus]|nr:hypothetical protein C2E23DRAFT_881303 [Lenzites betulinus]